ncbi:MAG: hypothetical protein WDZ57_03655, partial [Demequina sp.]
EGSVHRAPWPEAMPLRHAARVGSLPGSATTPDGEVLDPGLIASAGQALAALRKIKSEAKVSQRTEIESVDLLVPQDQVRAVHAAKDDLMAAGRVRALQVVDAVLALEPGVDGDEPEDGRVDEIADTTVIRTENAVLAD